MDEQAKAGDEGEGERIPRPTSWYPSHDPKDFARGSGARDAWEQFVFFIKERVAAGAFDDHGLNLEPLVVMADQYLNHAEDVAANVADELLTKTYTYRVRNRRSLEVLAHSPYLVIKRGP